MFQKKPKRFLIILLALLYLQMAGFPAALPALFAQSAAGAAPQRAALPRLESDPRALEFFELGAVNNGFTW